MKHDIMRHDIMKHQETWHDIIKTRERKDQSSKDKTESRHDIKRQGMISYIGSVSQEPQTLHHNDINNYNDCS